MLRPLIRMVLREAHEEQEHESQDAGLNLDHAAHPRALSHLCSGESTINTPVRPPTIIGLMPTFSIALVHLGPWLICSVAVYWWQSSWTMVSAIQERGY